MSRSATGFRQFILIGAAAGISACAATPEPSPPAAAPPAWFAEARAAAVAQGYPSLDDVPAAPRVATAADPGWDAVQTELVADRDALQADERASPAPADSQAQAEAFREDAVRVIETTRERY